MGEIVDTSKENLARFDGGERDEIIRRGHYSLKNRGKIAILAGLVGGAAKLIDAKEKSQEIVRILTEGRGVKRARAAALRGSLTGVEECLIGVSLPSESTFDELRSVDPAFSLVFRYAVEIAMERKRRELRRLEENMPPLDPGGNK